MSGLPSLLPKTIFKTNSPINGEISVIELYGRNKIVVGGLTQSGPIAEEIWGKAINKYQITNFKLQISNILVLGVGGGSLIKLLNQSYPQAKIVGVEIDPIMINLGKQYLGLDTAKNLEIIINDAYNYLQSAIRHKLTYDLIFIDMYLGDKIPDRCQSEEFLQNLKKIMAKNGIVFFNRLYYKNHISEAEIFLDKIKKIFNYFNAIKIFANLFIYAVKNEQC